MQRLRNSDVAANVRADHRDDQILEGMGLRLSELAPRLEAGQMKRTNATDAVPQLASLLLRDPDLP